VVLAYPTSSSNTPRYGYGKPPHTRLGEILSSSKQTYRAELISILEYKEELLTIPLRSTDPLRPHWLNAWLPGLDVAALYTYIRSRRPRRYLEVGSGISTMVAAMAKANGNLPTRITSIDPQPRAGIDVLCDEVIRRPLEEVEQSVFEDLGNEDIIFFDGSHQVFMNSDTVTFYLDILPALRDGVLVGIHDILWPDDYLPEWSDWYFSEQYLFAAYLLAGAAWIHPLLASNYASQDVDLNQILLPLWSDHRLAGVDPRGFAFWLTIARPEGRTDTT
jgi:hypothetical protein